MTKNIILYIRVSSKEQQDKGFSLQAQEKILREYFKDYEIIEVIYDNTSGMSLERKGIDKLRSLLPSTNFVGILDQDRLARDPKVLGVIEYFCNQNNVRIIYHDNPKGEELITDIKTAVAKDENKKRIERILRSKDFCFANGRHIAKPPFGYIYDKNTRPTTLKKNNSISVVKNIFDMKLNGKGYLKIAKELNITNKKGEIAPLQVRSILKNPFYCGFIKYKNKYKQGIHESVISQEDFIKLNGEKWKKLIE